MALVQRIVSVFMAASGNKLTDIQMSEENNTVRDIKEQLQAQLGFPRFQQRVLLDKESQQLADTYILNPDTKQIFVVLVAYINMSRSLEIELLHAINYGPAEDVEAILQRPQHPADVARPGSDLSLHEAATHNNTDIASMLVQANADTNIHCPTTRTTNANMLVSLRSELNDYLLDCSDSDDSETTLIFEVSSDTEMSDGTQQANGPWPLQAGFLAACPAAECSSQVHALEASTTAASTTTLTWPKWINATGFEITSTAVSAQLVAEAYQDNPQNSAAATVNQRGAMYSNFVSKFAI
ncbi:hypothetical protein AK812_SmicGene41834 [Symbiodinium microadriaticum]|uniref:Ubiquitin-like domain-containing protein n=1 Tax=Symbiodinium microadriaticum TaxID=2951 RepID=A0A1Q9C540_SYMMI|nr:hypothetical protein AK812_SmicGene41834 [Symbiodinium microadriaticum]